MIHLVQAAVPEISEIKKHDMGKEAVMEAEIRAARERALVPLEIRVKSFKEMLREKDVCSENYQIIVYENCNLSYLF